MTWLKAVYEIGSLFSYRIPDFSSQYALSSPLPGPSTIKLAIVATAIETTCNVSYGEKIFEVVKNSDIGIKIPKRISISNVLLRRLKKAKERKGFEQTFGFRGYVHFSEPLTIYLNIEKEEEEIKNLMGRIRRFGTSDSIVWCNKVMEEEPTTDVIIPIETLPEKEQKNLLIIPVKDLSPQSRFEDINPYSGIKRKGKVLIPKIYPLPLLNQIQGKNWVVYEFV